MPNKKKYTLRITAIVFILISQYCFGKTGWPGSLWISPNIMTSIDTSFPFEKINEGVFYNQQFCRAQDFSNQDIDRWRITFSNKSSNHSVMFNFVAKDFTEVKTVELLDQYASALGRLPWFILATIPNVDISQWDIARNIPAEIESMRGRGAICISPSVFDDSNLSYDIDGKQWKHTEFMEEIFLHEASHIGFDRYFLQRYQDNSKPSETQELHSRARYLDGEHISIYAWENEVREDNAESLAAWVYLRYFRDRLDDNVAKLIESHIPNRINLYDYFFLKEPLTPVLKDMKDPYGAYFSSTGELKLNRIDVDGSLFDILLELTDIENLLFKIKSYNLSH